MRLNFFAAAAGKQRDDAAALNRRFQNRTCHRSRFPWICQWMAHILGFDAALAIPLFFERKDHQHFADVFANLRDSSGAPRP